MGILSPETKLFEVSVNESEELLDCAADDTALLAAEELTIDELRLEELLLLDDELEEELGASLLALDELVETAVEDALLVEGIDVLSVLAPPPPPHPTNMTDKITDNTNDGNNE
ncbi:hypothetical protein GCM10011613_21770 [Cellvibrio zantedeschiae]|uniref:Uncharacterized protein n=1 Tax=Cellvibrio zantedeschiae TaxID=1237077 RepID=A0ABQ3B6W0_9GAMM|nr:hypothetical protein [Cellvibrio zantedeschiae]GGY76899.1 hypothetical protein GCM10011613_21770 [Cellvibrio zantedeschiae]